ncbi:MAG TPA: hypothetical protein VHV77_07545 [Pirellulales bacterium]|jgi:hypothetical protein|nr:hypothetical protein [Pirellulales bacterium]
MSFSWQDAIALVIVAAAVIYLARQAQLVLRRKRAAGCASGCPTCPSGKTAEPEVVALNVPKGNASQD